jgi:DNA-binding NtrC family response regulator
MKTNGSPSLSLDAGKIDQTLKIAVVDDDDGWELVSRLLGGDGRFSLCRAAGGDHLMEMLEQDGIDCVIIEIGAGNESGFAINERLRARDPVMPPAIMLTGMGREETVIQAFRSGFSDYLNKSRISSDSLPAAILRATHPGIWSRAASIRLPDCRRSGCRISLPD